MPDKMLIAIIYVYVYIYICMYMALGFPHSSVGKESACNAEDPGLIPGLGRSPGEGNEPTPVFLPEKPMDRGAWQAIVHGVLKSQT